MKESISYERAVIVFAHYYTGSMFDASTLLCELFALDDKEKTLQDLVNERERVKVK